MSQKKSPRFELRSGNVDALLLALKTADMAALRDDLLSRFKATPDFFSDDVIALDLRSLEQSRRLPLDVVIDTLATLKARAIGVVAREDQQAWAGNFGLPLLDSQSRRGVKEADAAPVPIPAPAPVRDEAAIQAAIDAALEQVRAQATQAAQAARSANRTILIDRPLRSGQQVYAEGDVVILDLVSHGAEVIAEGNIHIYAPLRGRALAGVKGNPAARIFCTCMEPELVSIAGIYRTAEQELPADVLGKSAQVRLADEKLILEPLRMK